MLFRIGINLGDVIVQGGDLLGDGVNVAARIQAVTEPGGICISGSVHEQIQNKLSLDFKLLGEHAYKNIAKPIRTFSVLSGDGTDALPSAPAVSVRAVRIGAVAILCVIAAAAGGYWLYGEYESKRAEQAALAAQLRRRNRQPTTPGEHSTSRVGSRPSLPARPTRNAKPPMPHGAKRRSRPRFWRQTRRAAVPMPTASVSMRSCRNRAVERSAPASRPEPVAEKIAAAAPAAIAAPPAAAAAPVVARPAKNGPFRRSLRRRDVQPSQQHPQSSLLAGGPDAQGWRCRRHLDRAGRAKAGTNPGDGRSGRYRERIARQLVLGGRDAARGAMRGHLADNHIDLTGRWSIGMGIDGHWARKR